MSTFSDVWNNLQLNVTKEITKIVTTSAMNNASNMGSLNFSYVRGVNHPITYKNNRAYKLVFTYSRKRDAMQMAQAKIRKFFPKLQRLAEKDLRENVLKQQTNNYQKLITNQENQVKEYELGSVKMSDGTTLYAHDKYGTKVPEALMMYYNGDNDVITKDVVYTETQGKMKGEEKKITSKTLLFIDLAPRVTCSSSKNIIMTTVQGRDYTRKELVSGGDLKFQINGTMVSDEVGVYPDSQVRKFIQMCQYGGVIKINHLLFKQFNVNQIIITDYSLGDSEYKNEQPYTFSCVAVEPDEDVKVSQDTIAILNNEIQASPMNKWYKLILDDKLAEIAANAATDVASSVAAFSLDKIMTDKI